jgi:enamine deaminase RidA (YjgF/YER057c/UK114 family)
MKMSVEQRIRELGFELPPPPKPVGAYVSAVRTGNLVFTAGQLPSREGKIIAAGKVPADVSLEAAQKAAQVAVLNGLAAVAGLVGSLDCVRRIVRLNCFVNSAAGFTDQAKVANGASELLAAIFGEAGKHSRCALGAAELPLNAALELDLVVEVG